jgi:hypothetical protein
LITEIVIGWTMKTYMVKMTTFQVLQRDMGGVRLLTLPVHMIHVIARYLSLKTKII